VGYVYLYDIATNQEVNRLPHVDNVTSVSFSPDGKQLVTVARKTVLLWDLQNLPRMMRENLTDIACAHLIRNFNPTELKFFFEGEEEDHQRICPNLPIAGEN
jgi:WD40 repeat protein